MPSGQSSAPTFVSRPAADVVRDAECEPDGWVAVGWADERPIYLSAQDILKAGKSGLELLCQELAAQSALASQRFQTEPFTGEGATS
jgi:hypothetical protein